MHGFEKEKLVTLVLKRKKYLDILLFINFHLDTCYLSLDLSIRLVEIMFIEQNPANVTLGTMSSSENFSVTDQ